MSSFIDRVQTLGQEFQARNQEGDGKGQGPSAGGDKGHGTKAGNNKGDGTKAGNNEGDGTSGVDFPAGSRQDPVVKQAVDENTAISMVATLPPSPQKEALMHWLDDHAGKPFSAEDRATFNALYEAAPGHKQSRHI